MIHSVRFIAVLDTNAVFPIVIRDLLFGWRIMNSIRPSGASIFLMNGKP